VVYSHPVQHVAIEGYPAGNMEANINDLAYSIMRCWCGGVMLGGCASAGNVRISRVELRVREIATETPVE